MLSWLPAWRFPPQPSSHRHAAGQGESNGEARVGAVSKPMATTSLAGPWGKLVSWGAGEDMRGEGEYCVGSE